MSYTGLIFKDYVWEKHGQWKNLEISEWTKDSISKLTRYNLYYIMEENLAPLTMCLKYEWHQTPEQWIISLAEGSVLWLFFTALILLYSMKEQQVEQNDVKDLQCGEEI